MSPGASGLSLLVCAAAAEGPGVTTAPICGEEPHSDTGGAAVVFGINHRTSSAQECCDRCQEHAKKTKRRPCNSWVFCPLPICWGLDTGWNHTFGECWLKYQADPTHPLYGQRGAYTDEFRRQHRRVRGGPPSHVQPQRSNRKSHAICNSRTPSRVRARRCRGRAA